MEQKTMDKDLLDQICIGLSKIWTKTHETKIQNRSDQKTLWYQKNLLTKLLAGSFPFAMAAYGSYFP